MIEKTNRSSKEPFDVEETTIMDLILALSRHLKLLLSVPFIFCSVTIVYVIFFTQPYYTSTSKIMSGSSGGGMSQAMGLAAQFGLNLPTGNSETKWVYPEIITSRTLAKSVLNRQFKSVNFNDKLKLYEILLPFDTSSGIDKEIRFIKSVDKLISMIDISENLKTSILTLSIVADEPRLSAEINMAIIEELDEHQKSYNKNQKSETKQFIENRIKETEKELILAEENLRSFRDRNRRIENSPSLQLEVQRLVREVTVLTGVFTTLKQQLETSKIEELRESDYVVILDKPEIPIRKSGPNKKLLVIMSGFLGLGFSLIIILLKESVINSRKEEKEKLIEAKIWLNKNLKELFSFSNKY